MGMDIKLKDGYTICFLGCGTMGTAVLGAVLDSLSKGNKEGDAPKPGKFMACVTRQESADRLHKDLTSSAPDIPVEILIKDNGSAYKADVFVLGSKPYMAEKILTPLQQMLEGKVLVSLLAGKTIADIESYSGRCPKPLVVRAMTNTPSRIGAGMTVLSFPDNADVDESVVKAVSWIFEQTGKCITLEEKQMDVSTALCGSSPAFCFLIIEALADGAVRMGMPYNTAFQCAAQSMLGAAKMVVESGQHPAVLKSAVCTPGGTTIGGLLALEDKGVRSSVARAVEESTNIAKSLGGGAAKK